MSNLCLVSDDNGNIYGSVSDFAKKLGRPRTTISYQLESPEGLVYGGVRYHKMYTDDYSLLVGASGKEVPQGNVSDPEYEEYLRLKNSANKEFQSYEMPEFKSEHGGRYAVALFSDVHYEEGVSLSSTLGLNEYNPDIANERINRYFSRLVESLKEDRVDNLIFGCLGDLIDGYLRESAMQENAMSPIEASLKIQSVLFAGLQYLVTNTDLKKIIFVGLTGNHGRTTKKIQTNNVRLNYEYLIYENIKGLCLMNKMPIEFCIPDSEIAVVTMPDGERAVFAHGWQIKSQGTSTVCGIYPALNRLSMKWQRVFKQEHMFIGHFHSCISIPHISVNGSIIGYNAFSMTNGFSFERPAQLYQLFEEGQGLILTRTIYCD